MSVFVCVCLSASIFLESLRWTDLHNFLCRSPGAVPRSLAALRYVMSIEAISLRLREKLLLLCFALLPFLWMTLHLALVGRMAMSERLNL